MGDLNGIWRCEKVSPARASQMTPFHNAKCFDATASPIHPGDLLTTSHTPGHAMKVSEDAKARFAVLGQALTGLAEGRGWVQVLVGKQ